MNGVFGNQCALSFRVTKILVHVMSMRERGREKKDQPPVVSSHGHQLYYLRLDVAVNDVLRVQVAQALHHLGHDS